LKISLTKVKDAIECIFVFIVLQLFSGAIIQVLNKATGVAIDGVNGDPKMQILWSAIYIITLLLTISRWKQFIHVASRNKLLLLLIGIALISFLWSAAPQVTLRRSVALVGTTLFGMYLATRYNPKELLRLIAWTFVIGAILSVIFALALPQYGIQPYSGSLTWRGIYRHKNLLGRLMALNAVVLFLLVPTIRRNRWLVWAAIGLSVGLLLLSQTKGGLLSFVILLILLPIYKALRLNYTLMLPFLIIVLNVAGIVIMWLVNNLEPLLTSIGKDITLSSRTPLWEAVIHKIQERPLLGIRIQCFLVRLAGESAYIWQS
jgi:O-antigen ligase